MPKARFSLLDVVAAQHEIGSNLRGFRVNNIYDINDKTYVFKMHRTQAEGGGKKLLLLESGIRFHVTSFQRDKSDNPSPFTMKLRKCIRGRRLVEVKQLGMDRVVCFTFGQNEAAYHLVLELYDKGNIVLCNHAHEIVALLRSHTFDEEKRVAQSRVYPYFQQGTQDSATVSEAERGDASFLDWLHARVKGNDPSDNTEAAITERESDTIKSGKKRKDKKKRGSKIVSIKQALCMKGAPYNVDEYGPDIIEHCLLTAGIDPGTKVETDFLERLLEGRGDSDGKNPGVATKITCALKNEPQNIVASIVGPTPLGTPTSEIARPKGFIMCKRVVSNDSAIASGSSSIASIADGVLGLSKTSKPELNDKKNATFMYHGFSPILLKQHQLEEESAQNDKSDQEGTTCLRFESFESAVDEYYARIETQRAQRRHNQAAKAVYSRLEKVKLQQEERLKDFKVEQVSLADQAAAIEVHSTLVQNATMVVNSMIAGGMEWDALWQMVIEEKRNGNPVASVISKLDLESNSMTLLLPKLGLEEEAGAADESSSDSSENESESVQSRQTKNASSMLRVKIDLSLTAFQNARAYYDRLKRVKVKTTKATEAAVKATKQAEKKSLGEIEKQKIKVSRTIIRHARKVHWFEKFKWFISSENYLVISGRDAEQNELLVKRYLRRGDVYVHADVHGASTCIVRNFDHKLPIAPLTLEEAGCFCMCNSSAWASRTVTSAWWVHKEQVSKTAPTGEYLTTGSFMIRGKKNFLRPSRLELGFGILFRIDESTVGTHHAGERGIRSMDVDLERARLKEEPTVEQSGLDGDIDLSVDAVSERVEEKSALDISEPPAPESEENMSVAPTLPDDAVDTFENFDEDTVKANLAQAAALSAHANLNNNEIKGNKTGNGLNRGQKRRMKKIKKKYANQSEDERRLRMAALGNPLPSPSVEEEPSTSDQGKEVGAGAASDKASSSSAETYIRMRERQRAAKAATDRRLREIETEEPGGSDHLDTLTGRPCDEDVFRYALPVCAPYSTLSKYKYKLKLTPGGSKRGKASKEALEIFLRMPVRGKGGNTTDREKEFIRLISDNERVQAMVARVKVSKPAALSVHGMKGKGGRGGKKAKGVKGGGKRAAAGKKKKRREK